MGCVLLAFAENVCVCIYICFFFFPSSGHQGSSISVAFQRQWRVALQGHQLALLAHWMQAAGPQGLVCVELLQVVLDLILTLWTNWMTKQSVYLTVMKWHLCNKAHIFSNVDFMTHTFIKMESMLTAVQYSAGESLTNYACITISIQIT